MTFEELLDQAIALLQRRGRITYRTLKRQFQLDDDLLEDLKEELIYGQRLAVDEDGRVLIWTGGARMPPESIVTPPTHVASPPAEPGQSDAERRQLTVLFCDLVDSTVLASQLDPEEWREVVRAYQATCAKVIARFDGYIAQYLGDGLLIYFGYPRAHEDDAPRAVRAGLSIVEAMEQLNARLRQERGVQLGVRLGIHTGLVVVGDVGEGTRQEQLALGETPHLAARLQGIAAPNTVVISAATFHLLGGFFACQALGIPALKGVAQPLEVYRVLYESMTRSHLDAAGSAGLTPLVGREQEVGLLRERWTQVKEGFGQVVLLSGEAGIGKSRLVQVLKEQVATEPQAWLTPCQCSPYHQNSALYPLIELLERVALRFEREESPEQKLRKLEGHLVQYGLPLAEAVPLFAALLSLPLTADYIPLTVPPEQQKQKTLQALLTILLRIAASRPVLFVMEDLHWVDPTTLEFLSLVVDQSPMARILALLTFRPDFHPPWTGRAHVTQITVPRLLRRQAAEMTGRVAYGRALPVGVVEQVVSKTDGVPLFVEELTKMLLESGLLQEQEDRYELTRPLPPLGIPATLHDSLMARLDRLATVKVLAQLGATLGREFAYDLLQAVAPWDEETLQGGLHQLVQAEFLYQRGLPPHATYLFKHALIRDTAYQSLLKSTRQLYHQRIAQVLVERFPAIVETQPELLAHHYTEAGLSEQALSWWQRAGQRALERSALAEAIAHFTKGLEVFDTLPDKPERARQELALRASLGVPLSAIKGPGAPEVFDNYGRARQLCHDIGEAPEQYQVLWGSWRSHLAIAKLEAAQDLADQLVALAQRQQDSGLLLEAHHAQWTTLSRVYEPRRCWHHAQQGIALYQPERHHRHVFTISDHDAGVCCRGFGALSLWQLGHPDQALTLSRDAVALARRLAHPTSLAHALTHATWLLQLRRDLDTGLKHVEEIVAVAAEQGFAQYLATAAILKGWLLTRMGQDGEGLELMGQGLGSGQAKGTGPSNAYFLYLLAEAYLQLGQAQPGLERLAEALGEINRVGTRAFEPEMHRVQGELLRLVPDGDGAGAEACFHKAIAMAQAQNARTLELRAAISLARMWHRQGKRTEARQLLAPIYGWFTEGFDTTDLQEANELLEELSR